jgi:hypothetical protein
MVITITNQSQHLNKEEALPEGSACLKLKN